MAHIAQSPARDDRSSGKPNKHVHHGKTPAAWAGSMLALVAVIVGGVAMLLGPNWVLFWIAAVLLVLAPIVARVLQVTGHGAD